MAIFYFINCIVAEETIEGGNYLREETIHGNTVLTSRLKLVHGTLKVS
jgi:hypothetical protein